MEMNENSDSDFSIYTTDSHRHRKTEKREDDVLLAKTNQTLTVFRFEEKPPCIENGINDILADEMG